ncbi:MAG: S24 family peptidase [Flavobacteriaceae bacterium]
MLKHRHIWNAIDRLAERMSLSPSALAKRAGLDPTSFNRSKRQGPDGRPRWPSTESIAKVLDATGISIEDFMALTRDHDPGPRYESRAVPLIGFAQAGAGGFFDDGGFPVGGGWDEVELPRVSDDNAYALSVSGDSMLPLYRDGDILVVSPNAAVRPGDRVVVKSRSGEVMAKVLVRHDASGIEIESLNPAHPPRQFAASEIEWIARIVWASQ